MNGTARAKARNDSVGKPGSLVADASPPEFTSISAVGKISGGTHIAGWRIVRVIPRAGQGAYLRGEDVAHVRARSATCSYSAASSSAAPSSERPVLAKKTSSRVGARSSMSASSNPLLVEAAHDVGEAVAVLEPDGDVLRRVERRAVAGEERGQAHAVVLLRRDRVQARAGRSRPSAGRASPRRRSGRGR